MLGGLYHHLDVPVPTKPTLLGRLENVLHAWVAEVYLRKHAILLTQLCKHLQNARTFVGDYLKTHGPTAWADLVDH